MTVRNPPVSIRHLKLPVVYAFSSCIMYVIKLTLATWLDGGEGVWCVSVVRDMKAD